MRSKSTHDGAPSRGRFDRSFASDERAIEGLPVRLVIALVVGVAALALMMSLLSGIGDLGETEVTVEIHTESEVIGTEGSDDRAIFMDVISEDGEPVESGRILIEAGTAQLADVQTIGIGEWECDSVSSSTPHDFQPNQVCLELDPSDGEYGLRADQNSGTLEISILPPSNSDYRDSLANPDIVVIDSDEGGYGSP